MQSTKLMITRPVSRAGRFEQDSNSRNLSSPVSVVSSSKHASHSPGPITVRRQRSTYAPDLGRAKAEIDEGSFFDLTIDQDIGELFGEDENTQQKKH
mmetsp:Transcript_57659/g.120540  ORF Transcript_57659/g.120540 Transcript_57659/m.120540 type:complete len:97 (+) Transcript_57659:158-448(+)